MRRKKNKAKIHQIKLNLHEDEILHCKRNGAIVENYIFTAFNVFPLSQQPNFPILAFCVNIVWSFDGTAVAAVGCCFFLFRCLSYFSCNFVLISIQYYQNVNFSFLSTAGNVDAFNIRIVCVCSIFVFFLSFFFTFI